MGPARTPDLRTLKPDTISMKYLRTYAKYLLLVELALVAVLVVGLLVPLPGKVEFKIVQSGSMEPVMPVGSMVAIVPHAEYAVGDIITFGDDTKTRIPTSHRVVGVTRESGALHYLTKGDANEEADNAPVPHSAVIGAVEFVVPRLGYVLHFARSERGFFLMAVVPAVLIMVDEVFTIAAILRRRRRTGMQPNDGRQHHSVSPPDAQERVSDMTSCGRLQAKPYAPALPPRRPCHVSVDGMRIVLRSV